MNRRGFLEDTANLVAEIHDKWAEGAAIDAGFDGGEFSGPASGRAAQAEAEELCARRGFTLDEVEQRLWERGCQELDEAVEAGMMAEAEYHQGRAGYYGDDADAEFLAGFNEASRYLT